MLISYEKSEPVLFLGGAHTQGDYAARANSCAKLSFAFRFSFGLLVPLPSIIEPNVAPIKDTLATILETFALIIGTVMRGPMYPWWRRGVLPPSLDCLFRTPQQPSNIFSILYYFLKVKLKILLNDNQHQEFEYHM